MVLVTLRRSENCPFERADSCCSSFNMRRWVGEVRAAAARLVKTPKSLVLGNQRIRPWILQAVTALNFLKDSRWYRTVL